MSDLSPIRLGIVRAPQASAHPLVAAMEARVLATELTRRLGPVTLDLRTDGEVIGPWQPLANAAWPGAIDAQLDATALWAAAVPLTALAGRTIEPAAAEVRARMLAHLGLVPAEPYVLDADRLAALAAASVRPTDLWLVARGARAVTTGDPAIDALTTPTASPAVAELDALLDAVVADVSPPTTTVSHLQTELAALRARVAELEADRQRTSAEVAARLDALTGERDVLAERLERAEHDRAAVG